MLALTIVSLLAGAVLIGAGLWLMRASAMPRHGADAARALPADGMSFSTRAAVGLSLMFAGYHGAAWGTPPGWLDFEIPNERWYLLVGGIAVAVGVSLALDRNARAAPDEPQP